MAGHDYKNQEGYAESIIDGTLRTLKDQEDDRGKQDLAGKLDINPQAFSLLHDIEIQKKLVDIPRHRWHTAFASMSGAARVHLVQGPIFFQKKFDKEPHIVFGQKAVRVGTGAAPSTVATSYTPFLVQPYTYDMIFTNGAVDGFYLGLYALTSPPIGVTKHTIDWRATGPASNYEQTVEESWTEGYDQNEATFLVDEIGEFEE